MFQKRNYIILFSFIIVLLIVGIWVIKIVNGEVPYVDQWTRDLVMTFKDTKVFTFFRVVTELGSKPFVEPFTIGMTLILFGIFRDWLPALIFGGGTLASHKLNELLKVIVARERPTISIAANAEGYSFPSGHAMVSMVCYGLLAYFIVKKIKNTKVIIVVQITFALLIFLIGISRYVINVHYLTDITAGFFIGFLCFIGLIYFYEFIQKKRART